MICAEMGCNRCSRISRQAASVWSSSVQCCLAVVCFLLLLISSVQGSESNHRYKDSEEVVLWVNKVGPYNNPQVRR